MLVGVPPVPLGLPTTGTCRGTNGTSKDSVSAGKGTTSTCTIQMQKALDIEKDNKENHLGRKEFKSSHCFLIFDLVLSKMNVILGFNYGKKQQV